MTHPTKPEPSAQAMPSLPNWTALSITTPNQYKTVECMWEGAASGRKVSLFTADQMRAYGQACAQWQATRQAPSKRELELEAARIAYASEFPLNDDGEPDVGNIHVNIRAIKAAGMAD